MSKNMLMQSFRFDGSRDEWLMHRLSENELHLGLSIVRGIENKTTAESFCKLFHQSLHKNIHLIQPFADAGMGA